MLDADDTKVLQQVRAGNRDFRPSWKNHLPAFIFIFGGLALAAFELSVRERPGMPAGFMLGAGLLLLLATWPSTRHAWRCHRLIRHADERGAFDDKPSG